MPTKTWKSTERSFAKAIGGHRNHFESEDICHESFSAEVKHRQLSGYPKSVRSWYEQAKANCAPGKIAILSIHLAGEIHPNDLVIMSRSDFESLLGKFPSQKISCHEKLPKSEPVGLPISDQESICSSEATQSPSKGE